MDEEKLKKIKEQAEVLAKDNKKAETEIKQIYWFPNENEVRLVELEDNIVTSASGCVEPFYFSASPADNLPAPSGIAIIRSDEFRKIELPENWGSWDDAKKLEIEE